MAKDNKKGKKPVMMIPTAGKTKEEIIEEAKKILRKKGLLKESENDKKDKEDEV